MFVTGHLRSKLNSRSAESKKPKETQVKNKKQPNQSLIYTVGFLFPITVAYLVHLLKIHIHIIFKENVEFFLTPDSSDHQHFQHSFENTDIIKTLPRTSSEHIRHSFPMFFPCCYLCLPFD